MKRRRNKRNNHLVKIDNAARIRRGYNGEKLLKEKRKYAKKAQW
jgi:hypothetical protein